MDKYSQADVKDIEAWMNDYPRRIFGGETSRERFEKELAKLD